MLILQIRSSLLHPYVLFIRPLIATINVIHWDKSYLKFHYNHSESILSLIPLHQHSAVATMLYCQRRGALCSDTDINLCKIMAAWLMKADLTLTNRQLGIEPVSTRVSWICWQLRENRPLTPSCDVCYAMPRESNSVQPANNKRVLLPLS